MAPKSPDTNRVEALQANVAGSGAVAQGGGDALGERSVKGDNYGTIVTGTQIVIQYDAIGSTGHSKEEITQQVVGYLRWLRARTERIALRGIERAGGAPVVLLPLETAYVPLRAKSVPRIGDGQAEKPRWRGDRRTVRDRPFDAEPKGRESDIGLNEALGLGNRLVIIGGPGSGKTTVLSHMAWALASSLLTGEPEPARSRLGLKKEVPLLTGEPESVRSRLGLKEDVPSEVQQSRFVPLAPRELPLPIFVPLASFARHRRGLQASASARGRTLAHFISHHLVSKTADFDLPADFFVQLLKDGRIVLLLLDGLDEVADENERAEVRQSVEELVAGREAMRVVVTCRTVAYSGRTALGADFREIAVQPLDYEQHIVPMVRQAYACIYPADAALRDDRVKDLLDGIERLEQERCARLGKDAEVLVDSPLMVRLLLIVHVNNRTLPDARADLFDKAINALLQVDYGTEESDIRELATDWKLYRDMAQHLALHMHQLGRDQGRENEEPELRKTLREEAEFEARIDDFLSHSRQRGSVLEERDGAYRFIHLAFQEFLVARYLSEVTGGDSREAMLDFLDKWLDDPWWREPILLLAGYMGAKSAKSARHFLAALANAGKTPNAQFWAAELAGTAALEWRESGETIRANCAQRVMTLLRDTNALAHFEPAVRARAGEVLSRLGDRRFDRDRFFLPTDDLFGFVRIPADPDFTIGTRKADALRVEKIIAQRVPDNEINDDLTPTPEFFIARYPVTVGQFKAFIDATAFSLGDDVALRDADSRPIRFVSWHEALAYCEWLNQMFATSPSLEGSLMTGLVRDSGWRVSLPSELEWEKAARGGLRDAVFPWGDAPDPNRANYDESGIGDTSAVGCFPANGFGLYDMVGNVWEWTRSLWGQDTHTPDFKYPYRQNNETREDLRAEGTLRVLRGGSFNYRRLNARCAHRHGNRPDYRASRLGFRVMLRSAPVF